MRKVKIITDSTADMGSELVRRYDVDIIPLIVHLGEDEYMDGVDITTKDVFNYVSKTKQLPKTAAASMIDIKNVFQKWIDMDYDVIYTGIGSKLSATYMSAKLACESLPEGRVHLVDSQNLSTGIGLLVAKAGDMALAGCEAKEIAAEMTNCVPKVRAGFIVDTVEYLYMGGRCSSLESFMAGMLKLRPRLAVKDGIIISDKKYRGNYDRCLTSYAEDIIESMTNADKSRVFITNAVTPDSELSKTDSDRIRDMLVPLGFGEIVQTGAGSVISSHCGPRTLGILYMDK